MTLTLKQSLKGEVSVETLGIMHERMMGTLTGEKLFDYLLSSVPYLKTDDLEGWKTEFCPVAAIPMVKAKNLRQSPNLAPYIPLPACDGCGSVDVIDDVPQGQYVCVSCGLIQQAAVFTGGSAHCSFDRLKNTARVHIHRYSRIVHFRTTIRLMQGDSCPEMGADTLSRLRAALDGSVVTVEKVSMALRKLGISRRYRRHRWRLMAMVTGVVVPELEASVLLPMLKLFRRLEYYWNFYHDIIAPKRKVFLSYRFVFYQFAHQMGRPDVTGPHHLLKNDKLSTFQFDSYRRACKYTGFPIKES